MHTITAKQYNAYLIGARSRAAGAQFENEILASLRYYENQGTVKADKTPEPMKTLSGADVYGHFKACFTKKAQADFSGTLKGGRAVRFEAKQTSGDRFERSRLTNEQMKDLREHGKLGALCFVILCFTSNMRNNYYRIPFGIWDNMKNIFGRQYVKESDVEQYRILCKQGIIRLFTSEEGEMK